MTKVRYLQCMAGDRFTRNVGDVANVSDDEAKRFVAAGYAEIVADEKAGGESDKKAGGKKSK